MLDEKGENTRTGGGTWHKLIDPRISSFFFVLCVLFTAPYLAIHSMQFIPFTNRGERGSCRSGRNMGGTTDMQTRREGGPVTCAESVSSAIALTSSER